MNERRYSVPDVLADEAARLFEAVDAVTGRDGRPTQPRSSGGTAEPQVEAAPATSPESAQPPSDASSQGTGSDAEHPSTCTWCPVCRGVANLRAIDPDTVARLADAVTMLAEALGELAGNVREHLPVPRSGGPAPEATGNRAAAGGGTAYGRSAGAAGSACDGLDAAWSRGAAGARRTAYDIPVLGEEDS